jgi:hypothetical protein
MSRQFLRAQNVLSNEHILNFVSKIAFSDDIIEQAAEIAIKPRTSCSTATLSLSKAVEPTIKPGTSWSTGNDVTNEPSDRPRIKPGTSYTTGNGIITGPNGRTTFLK